MRTTYFRDFNYSLRTVTPYQYSLGHLSPGGNEDFIKAWYESEQYTIVMNLPTIPHNPRKLHSLIREQLKAFYKLID